MLIWWWCVSVVLVRVDQMQQCCWIGLGIITDSRIDSIPIHKVMI